MLALGVLSGVSDAPADDTNAAVSLATGCYAMYTSTPTGLAPDAWRFKRDKGDCTPTATGSKFSLRPETIESLFYLWRLTKNETYREWGWNIFNALETHTKTTAGYAGLTNVYRAGSREDSEPSFMMAEVHKYLFLLFSPEQVMPLDQWVLNTEAHPFLVHRDRLSPWRRV